MPGFARGATPVPREAPRLFRGRPPRRSRQPVPPPVKHSAGRSESPASALTRPRPPPRSRGPAHRALTRAALTRAALTRAALTRLRVPASPHTPTPPALTLPRSHPGPRPPPTAGRGSDVRPRWEPSPGPRGTRRRPPPAGPIGAAGPPVSRATGDRQSTPRPRPGLRPVRGLLRALRHRHGHRPVSPPRAPAPAGPSSPYSRAICGSRPPGAAAPAWQAAIAACT